MSTATYTLNTPDVVVDEKIYDLVGLGFGPANVALAGALIERWESGEVHAISLDHRGYSTLRRDLASSSSSNLHILSPRLLSTLQDVEGLIHVFRIPRSAMCSS